MKKIPSAHAHGCLGVSWGPAVPVAALVSGAAPAGPARKLVSGGCDRTVKVWRQEGTEFVEEQCWREHGEWVRDVAWAPSLGLPSSTIASCSQDGKVLVHGQDQVRFGEGGWLGDNLEGELTEFADTFFYQSALQSLGVFFLYR